MRYLGTAARDVESISLRHGAIGVSDYHDETFREHAAGDVEALLEKIEELETTEAEEIEELKGNLEEAEVKVKDAEQALEVAKRDIDRYEEAVKIVLFEARDHAKQKNRQTGQPFVTIEGAIAATVFFSDLHVLGVIVSAWRKRGARW